MAKININLIEGYESMSAEDKIKALENFEYEDSTSELERYKKAVTKANAEAAEWKRKHKELLTDEEKTQQEKDEAITAMKTELETLKREKTVSEYKSKYLSLGYDETLATDTAKALAEGDVDTVFKNHSKFTDDMSKRIESDILKNTPRPTENGSGRSVVSKADFDKMDYSALSKFRNENPELYNQYMGR